MQKQTLAEYLSLRTIVDDRLDELVSGVDSERLREASRHALAGGKRIRPLMTMLACSAVGGEESDALDAGVAIELLHASSLVHDDIMDSSAMRRGRDTVHARFGIPCAILTGDALIALAFSVIQRMNAVRQGRINEAFSRGFLAMCEGQSDDLSFSGVTGVDVHTHRTMVEKKTARLLEAATLIGALIGTEDARLHNAMAEFGLKIGMAYQAHDDRLDVAGAEEVLGKPVGVDARNGKQTFLTTMNGGTDAMTQIGSVVEEYTVSACEALDVVRESQARESLRALAGYLVGREM